MDISAIIKAIVTPLEGQRSDEMPALQPGDRLTGRVLKLEADGRVLIDLGNFRALAQTTVRVQPGQTLQLQVVKTGVPLHLKVDAQDGLTTSRPVPQMALPQVLSEPEQQRMLAIIERIAQLDKPGMEGQTNEGVKHALIQIKSAFDGLDLLKAQDEVVSGLRKTLEDSGLFLEKKISDMAKPVADQPTVKPSADSILPAKSFVPPTESGITTGQLRSGTENQALAGTARLAQQESLPKPDASNAVEKAIVAESGKDPSPTQKAVISDSRPAMQDGPTATALIKPGVLASLPGTPSTNVTMADKDLAAPLKAILASNKEEVAEKEPAAASAFLPETPAGGKTTLSTALFRDFKAQLLTLKSFLTEGETRNPVLNGMSSKDLTFLSRRIERLLDHVELQQERLVQRAGDGDAYQVVAHTLTTENRTRPVKLKVYYPRKKSGSHGQGHNRVALLLDLDRLGLLRVDLAAMGPLLQVDFYVRDERIQKIIGENKERVEKELLQNFTQVVLNIRISNEKIAGFDQEDQSGVMVGRIDIQA